MANERNDMVVVKQTQLQKETKALMRKALTCSKNGGLVNYELPYDWAKGELPKQMNCLRPQGKGVRQLRQKQPNSWTESIAEARAQLGLQGFVPIKKGEPLYQLAKQLNDAKKAQQE